MNSYTIVSQSTSCTLKPSAKEQHKPFPLARRSNHGLSGEFANLPSSRALSWFETSLVRHFAKAGGHSSTGGHHVAFLVRTVRLCKPRAAAIGFQRQSLVPPAIAERSLAGLHTGLSAARFGHPEIPTHRDAPRPCLC